MDIRLPRLTHPPVFRIVYLDGLNVPRSSTGAALVRAMIAVAVFMVAIAAGLALVSAGRVLLAIALAALLLLLGFAGLIIRLMRLAAGATEFRE